MNTGSVSHTALTVTSADENAEGCERDSNVLKSKFTFVWFQ